MINGVVSNDLRYPSLVSLKREGWQEMENNEETVGRCKLLLIADDCQHHRTVEPSTQNASPFLPHPLLLLPPPPMWRQGGREEAGQARDYKGEAPGSQVSSQLEGLVWNSSDSERTSEWASKSSGFTLSVGNINITAISLGDKMRASPRSSSRCTRTASRWWTSTRMGLLTRMTSVEHSITWVSSCPSLNLMNSWERLEVPAPTTTWSRCSRRRWLEVCRLPLPGQSLTFYNLLEGMASFGSS